MRQKGFVPIIFVIVCAVIGIGATFGIPYVYQAVRDSFTTSKTENMPSSATPVNTSIATPTLTPTSNPAPATKIPTPKPTIRATTKPRPTALPTSSTATPSCNYDLNSATGAIEFIFHPTKGSQLYWSTRTEVKAQNGCKVLDGRSTDTIQPFASTTQLNAVVPGLPPGTYDVRYSYHDNWSSSQSVSVSSGGRTQVDFTVDNSSDP